MIDSLHSSRQGNPAVSSCDNNNLIYSEKYPYLKCIPEMAITCIAKMIKCIIIVSSSTHNNDMIGS